jgi:hypothetical protein
MQLLTTRHPNSNINLPTARTQFQSAIFTILIGSSMYWMQNLMKRRQPQSPSSSDTSSRASRGLFGSKYKRRALRKDSNATEGESLCSQSSSEKTDSAPWRVGTFSTAVSAPTWSAGVSLFSKQCKSIAGLANSESLLCCSRKYPQCTTNGRRMVGRCCWRV